MKFSLLKRILGIALLMSLVLSCGVMIPLSASADEDISPYLYAEPHPGIVVCTQLTVRNRPATGGKQIGQLKNMQICTIVGKYNDWYILDTYESGLPSDAYAYGYAKDSLILQDPYWVVTTKYTPLYCSPWRMDNLRNGEQSGRVLLVIEENYPWYCVQCKESTAGSSFVRREDIGQYSTAEQNLYVVVQDKAELLSEDWAPVETLSRTTIADVIETRGAYSHVRLYAGTDKETIGWILSKYLQRIVN